jgi:hypothetical protein
VYVIEMKWHFLTSLFSRSQVWTRKLNLLSINDSNVFAINLKFKKNDVFLSFFSDECVVISQHICSTWIFVLAWTVIYVFVLIVVALPGQVLSVVPAYWLRYYEVAFLDCIFPALFLICCVLFFPHSPTALVLSGAYIKKIFNFHIYFLIPSNFNNVFETKSFWS